MVQLPKIEGQNGSTDDTVQKEQNPLNPNDFGTIRSYLQGMVNDWEHRCEKARENRKTRDVQISVETLRREGTLDEDETIVPVRIIDTNITREQPAYINYIKNSRRVAIFSCLDNPNLPTDRIELEFTRGMTYTSWESAHFKTLDGAQTHGWDAVEVVYDTSKPFHVGIEHVGHDNLFWPQTCVDLQQAPRVIRAYDYTLLELKMFVEKFGWDQTQVAQIQNSRNTGRKEAETCRIYKVLFKEDGYVKVAWFSLADGCSDWLKAPMPHYVGINEQDPVSGEWAPSTIKDYPIFLLPYRESEKKKLVDRHGRVFIDGPKQEAQTGILSAFINGVSRASRVLASPKQDDGTGNSVKEVANQEMQGGTILDKPIDFYNPPYPDFQILKALSYLDTSNSNETNQTNFAVMNREDSRKTAKEITLAEQQSQLLNSVQLTLFSTYIRSIYSFAWLIVQSQALQGLIRFLLINKQQPQTSPVDGQPIIDQQTGQPVMVDNWQNDFDTIKHEFELRAAGDVDVIQKSERIQQMKQDWPVVQNTPLSMTFLMDLIRLSYPDKGEQYARILEQGQQNEVKTLGALASGLTKVLEAMVKNHPEVIQSLSPQDQQQLQQLLQAGNQASQQQQQPQQKGQ